MHSSHDVTSQELVARKIMTEGIGHDVPSLFLVNTPTLRAAIIKAFARIDVLESEIAERQKDIKHVKRALTDNGIPKKGIDLALARRKMGAKGCNLEQIDDALRIICSISSFGIQGGLFDGDKPSGNGADFTSTSASTSVSNVLDVDSNSGL